MLQPQSSSCNSRKHQTKQSMYTWHIWHCNVYVVFLLLTPMFTHFLQSYVASSFVTKKSSLGLGDSFPNSAISTHILTSNSVAKDIEE